MLTSYEDYLLIETYINDKGFEVLNEKNLSSKINNDIKFAVVMPTYKITSDAGVHKTRANHMSSVDVLKDSLGSIKNQKFKNWKLFIVGDKYEDDQELKDLLSSMFKPDQYQYFNLPKPGERDSNITSEEKRLTGGIKAVNKGLDMAASAGFDYITRLDHDDKWSPNHLELLAKAYSQFPNLGFVFTQGKKKIDATNSTGGYMMMPDASPVLDVNNKGYATGQTAASSVSWCPRLIGKFKYRDAATQKGTAPKQKKTIAGDVDLFQRMMKAIKDKEHKYMFIPKMTVYHRNRKGKF
tara:strand:+ start:1285 stop:2172 length:888 start_codon:yes stop_codon:yes gene_type:complete